MHGFIFTDENIETYLAQWKYGNTYCGDYCTAKTINYCTKYALKVDKVHKDYKQIILCSKGIGRNYIEQNRRKHQYTGENTNEAYTLGDGNKCGLPIYYRNKLFTEREREKLWLNKIKQGKRYIRGIEVDISTDKGLEEYETILTQQQIENENLGYGNLSNEWKKKDYNTTLRVLNAKRSYQKLRKL